MADKSHAAAEAADTSEPPARSHHHSIPIPERRNWLVEGAALFFGGLVAMIPPAVGAITFLDPWRRSPSVPQSRRQAAGGKEGFVRVASLDALPVGGQPQRFPVVADQLDAWNFTPDQPIGAVFLQQTAPGDVRCFNATCPHAGCSVSCEGQAFVCPCHNSSFNLDGSKRTSDSGRENPSPRQLDSLRVDPDKLAENEVWVEFINFYTGKHDKIPKI
ncbi:MAG: ubiquinol-cytochrome c reductase iron-sulfur subunit [Pirellulaceae bacterium]